MLEKHRLAYADANRQENRGAPRGLRSPKPPMNAQQDENDGRTKRRYRTSCYGRDKLATRLRITRDAPIGCSATELTHHRADYEAKNAHGARRGA